MDVDCKDKKTGEIIDSCFDYVEQLFDECPLGKIVHVVQTRSGGYHIYLACEYSQKSCFIARRECQKLIQKNGWI